MVLWFYCSATLIVLWLVPSASLRTLGCAKRPLFTLVPTKEEPTRGSSAKLICFSFFTQSIVPPSAYGYIVKWLHKAMIYFYCSASLIVKWLNGCAKRRFIASSFGYTQDFVYRFALLWTIDCRPWTKLKLPTKKTMDYRENQINVHNSPH